MQLPVLADVRIASPCPMRWEDLQPGEGSARFCTACSRTIHDLTSMTRDEVQALLESEPGACGMLRRRVDGLVMVGDCPVGVRRIRERAVRMATRVAMVALMLLGVGALASRVVRSSKMALTWRGLQHVPEDRGPVAPPATLYDTQELILGKIIPFQGSS
ncbi:MAG: hypothetical protein KDA28_13100 [Phycisphaerales bacterium]|nr:hypothetical protein [Phycisphaerales bacterium]